MRYYTSLRGSLQSQMSIAVFFACCSRAVATGSQPVPGVLAVTSRGSSVAVRLIRILVGVLVVLLHQRRVVPALLRARRQTVAVFPRVFVVVVLIGGHDAVMLDG